MTLIMVLWNDLITQLRKNTNVFSIHPIQIHEQKEIDKFYIPKFEQKSIEPKSVEPKSVEPKSVEPKSVEPKSVEPKSVEQNPIAKSIPQPRQKITINKPLFLDDEEDDELPPLPPVPTIVRQVARLETPKARKPSILHETKLQLDPICLGLEKEELLYSDAPPNNRLAIEKEAAMKYESQFNELYKMEGGRNRGWIKGTIESFIKQRVACGGDLKALNKAKSSFLWNIIQEKDVSMCLDYICVVKKIRVIVWTEDKKAYLYPAADLSTYTGPFEYYHMNEKGLKLTGLHTGEDILNFIEKEGVKLLPCSSVLTSLNRLNLEELENIGKSLGMIELSGKKSERIESIASFKLKQRLNNS